jgi:4-diphosphocytidyl-2-C-methyl-D-erythritol kinase
MVASFKYIRRRQHLPTLKAQTMIVFPCAKINLGLNIVSKREDGYHNLETVFYPIPLYDALEIKYMDEKFPSQVACDLKVTGNAVECDEQNNLVVKAYNLLAEDYKLPRVHAHLYKHIPSQAGLGGGSSDAAFMIRLLDERFRLNIGNPEMEKYAARLGADCAFFIEAEPAYAEGIGDELMPVDGPKGNLNGYYLAIVKPDIAVSTKEAYAAITPKATSKSCREIVRQPIETWKEELVNDFEAPIFKLHPELAEIKEKLYQQGAKYAAMSGSGSALFGIFETEPNGLKEMFQDCFCEVLKL